MKSAFLFDEEFFEDGLEDDANFWNLFENMQKRFDMMFAEGEYYKEHLKGYVY